MKEAIVMFDAIMADVTYGCFFLLTLAPILISACLCVWLVDKMLEKYRRKMIREKRKEETLKREQEEKAKFIKELGL